MSDPWDNLPRGCDITNWLDGDEAEAAAPGRLIRADDAVHEEAIPPAFTDEALALRFAEKHAHNLRFVSAWGKWLSWSGTHWKIDDTLLAFDLSRAICREAAAQCNKTSTASILASAKTVAAVERLAKADRRLAATVDQWDADPWLFNTPDALIDLRTGLRTLHDPANHLTKIAATSPAGSCPGWLAHLDKVLAGDAELQGFLKRLLGYSLTGSTQAHALFFMHGTGANGKSVVIDTVAGILGDYHMTAPIETFTASSTERHPTELAGLRGARLVTAVETEEGRRWAESRIKTLTGGDRISARFMRQDFFEYQPQFKLLIAGNHKPGLRSIDEAIRRRFNLIPFTVTIPPGERVEGFGDKLKAEWPGILQWMIEGCREWQRDGLNPPQAVTDATAAYLDAQDALSAWIEDKCECAATGWEGRAALFDSWSKWAGTAGEHVGSRSRFIDAMENRGFEQSKRQGLGFRGISLKQLDYSDAHWNH
jgi:putative DNA primase/helicase